MAMTLHKRVTDLTLNDASVAKDAPDAVPGTAVRVPTLRFGTLDVDEDLVITFADGLIGFENCRHFLIIHPDAGSAFRWLQSLDEPALAFPVVEPNQFRPDYAPTISDTDAQGLGLAADTPALLYTILTVPPQNPQGMTANLLGPLVINATTRRAKQVIVLEEGYTTRHEVVKELMRASTLAVTSQEPTTPAEQKAARPLKPARAA